MKKLSFQMKRDARGKIMLMPEEWKSPVERHHIWSADMILLLAKRLNYNPA